MEKLIVSLSLALALVSLPAFANNEQPSQRGRKCARQLVDGRFLEEKESIERGGMSESYDDEFYSESQDWDGSYSNNSARDPGGF